MTKDPIVEGLKPKRVQGCEKPTLDQFVGIARGSGPIPNDDQVGQWIDEARMQKYGR